VICFVDTSAIIAVTDPNDLNHVLASRLWTELLATRSTLLTTNYVVVETTALMHARRGLPIVRRFVSDIVPVLAVEWIGPEIHEKALSAVLAGGRGGPSLVDSVSFEVMKRHELTVALSFDRHFDDQGYQHPSVTHEPG
jgi:predicted nucleic acid-binding protein